VRPEGIGRVPSPQRTWDENDGRSPSIALSESNKKHSKKIIFGPRTLVRTRGTRPVSFQRCHDYGPVQFPLALHLDWNSYLFGSEVGGLIDELEAYRHEPEG
jgi:hypothetical protein